jgi:hypothetical protein
MSESTSPDALDDRQILDAAIQTIVGMITHAESLRQQVPQQPAGVIARVKRGVRRRLVP